MRSQFRFTLLTAALLLRLGASPLAADVLDDFEREGPEPGPAWTIVEGNWGITGGALHNLPPEDPINLNDHLIYFNQLELTEAPFTIQADLAAMEGTRWTGLAFNVIDAANYYILRIRPDRNQWQFVRRINGWSNAAGANVKMQDQELEAGVTYRFVVTSPSIGDYTVSLYRLDENGQVLDQVMEHTRTETDLAGRGHIGFASGPHGEHPTISVESVSLELGGAEDMELRILDFWRDGTQFHLSFETVEGVLYAVEYQDQLGAAEWQLVASVDGDGTVQTVSKDVSGADRRFFRLRAEPN